MTDSERIAALIAYRMQQADEAVAAADLDLRGGFERAAVDRAYYAMFYAVLALLVVRKLGTSKHSAAISYFDLLYYRPPRTARSTRSMNPRAVTICRSRFHCVITATVFVAGITTRYCPPYPFP